MRDRYLTFVGGKRITTAPEDVIARWWQRPDIFVREVFGATPDPWQDDVLRAFPTSPRIAMKASKGPGKTATLAWCCWNYLTTRPHPNIAATAINGANLRANLWKEMASWQNRSPLLLDQFEITSTQIVHRKHRRTWTMDARTWSKSADKEQIGNTLAGLHAPYLLFVLDESGAMPPEILDSAEGGFASSSQECHILQAGNTNSLQGALYYACVKHKDQWLVVPINGDPDNPKRSSRVSLEWAKEQIKAHGRNNPFIKVSILGEWPAQSFNALIGPDELEAATKRFYREYEIGGAARVLGVDVARYGTAASVICPRQGLQCFPMTTLRGVSSIQGAGAVARKWNEWNADACFIDMTGGFGSGWFDQLQQLGKTPIGVTYSGEAHNPSRYYNKRAEMYFDAVEWIKRGGALPDDCPELLATLAETNYTFAGERLILEPKEDIEERLGYSLDHSDAFVQTHAEPVSPKNAARIHGARQSKALADYDGFKEYFDKQ